MMFTNRIEANPLRVMEIALMHGTDMKRKGIPCGGCGSNRYGYHNPILARRLKTVTNAYWANWAYWAI